MIFAFCTGNHFVVLSTVPILYNLLCNRSAKCCCLCCRFYFWLTLFLCAAVVLRDVVFLLSQCGVVVVVVVVVFVLLTFCCYCCVCLSCVALVGGACIRGAYWTGGWGAVDEGSWRLGNVLHVQA